MKKEELEQAYWIKKELRMWQERRAELEADIAPPVKQITGMPFANTNEINSPTEEKALRLMECAKIIDGKIVELKLAIEAIEEFILTIEDSHLRQILEYRCVYWMKWKDIATRIGDGYTDESIRQTYHRFVRSLK